MHSCVVCVRVCVCVCDVTFFFFFFFFCNAFSRVFSVCVCVCVCYFFARAYLCVRSLALLPLFCVHSASCVMRAACMYVCSVTGP